MHYKDGTEVKLGDIIQHDAGHVGIVIGGQIGNDYCSTQVVVFKSVTPVFNAAGGPGYIGVLRDKDQKLQAIAGVTVVLEYAMQTREMMKIGHVDIGHG